MSDEEKKKISDAEAEYIFLKSYTCPVCENKLYVPTVKSGKTRMISQDWDLRPVFKNIDTVKYDVIHCNRCGYAALTRYYGVLAKPHKELLLEKIAANYKPIPEPGDSFTYADALVRYMLALKNAEARLAHDSEKAMISIKIGWLYRGAKQSLGDPDKMSPEDKANYDALDKKENEYLEKAMEGFIAARMNEAPPIAGMNEVVLDFLIAALCSHFNRFEDASRLIAGILQSKQASSQQMDKARDMLAEMRERMPKQ